MKTRWLFIFLCIFLAQLRGSEHLANSSEWDGPDEGNGLDTAQLNGSEHLANSSFWDGPDEGNGLDTISSNLSIGNVFYGDEPINGSHFSSGVGKIRRARSIDEDLEKAKEEVEIAKKNKEEADAAKATANGLYEAAKEATIKATKEWKAAIEELSTIELNFTQALENKGNAETAKTEAVGNITKIIQDIENAKNVHKAAEDKWKRLDEDAKTKEEAERVAKQKLQDAQGAEFAAKNRRNYLFTSWGTANTTLGTKIIALNTSNATLQTAKNKVAQNEERIIAYETYKKFEKNKTDAKSSKEKLTNDKLNPKTQMKIRLQNKKTMLGKNSILDSTLNWKKKETAEMTVDEALLYYKGTKQNKNLTDKEIDLNDSYEFHLNSMKSFDLTGKVKTLVAKYDEMKRKANDDIIQLDKELLPIGYEIGNLTLKEAHWKKEMEDLETKLGKKFNVIESDWKYATSDKVADIGKLTAAQIANNNAHYDVGNQTIEADTCGEEYNAANVDWVSNTTAVSLAEGVIPSLTTAAQTARTAANDVKTLELDPAFEDLKAKKELKGELEEKKRDAVATDSKADDFLTSVGEVKREQIEEIGKKKDAKDEKEKLEGKSKDALFEKYQIDQSAATALTTKKDKEKELTEAQAQERKKEREFKDMINSLTTGLGITGGLLILIVIGAIIAFVLIRRRKKKAAAVAAQPRIIKEYRPCAPSDGIQGLQELWSIDTVTGEEIMLNPGCIPGESFTTSVLVTGGITNHYPEEHKLAGQTDGDVLLGPLRVDHARCEAKFIGEGVEKRLEDSVDESEQRGIVPLDLTEAEDKERLAKTAQLCEIEALRLKGGMSKQEEAENEKAFRKLSDELEPLDERKTKFETWTRDRQMEKEEKEQKEKKENEKKNSKSKGRKNNSKKSNAKPSPCSSPSSGSKKK